MLRGGSWNNNQKNARCAYRNDNHPDNRNDNIGFRVVVSHDSHTPPEMRLGRRPSRRGTGREPVRLWPWPHPVDPFLRRHAGAR